MEVVVGTYEEALLGFRLEKKETGHEKEDVYKLERTFANHIHVGSVRSVACTPRLLASGSTDTTIRICNLRSRVEVGMLVEHQDSVTALEFYKTSHLVSGSEDGTICVWRVHDWSCEKTLHGHDKAVTSLSIHPSGKMLLSLSKDKTLRTWNLVKGRSAYVTNIKAVGDVVQWSPDGDLYAVAIDKTLHVYSVQIAGVVHKIDFGKKILTIAFITPDQVAIGGDGHDVEIHQADRSAVLCVFRAHTNRVKTICCIDAPEGMANSSAKWLVSGSSDGYVKLWQLDTEKVQDDPSLVAEVDTGCRITCLAVAQSIDTNVVTKDEKQVTKSTKTTTDGTKKKKVSIQLPPKKRKKLIA